ncbi:DUF3566 domain-containing protein [Corynebacterium spheniscorum]|uniref:DUF3566 domain-containing protein n=1 Tax=Corynebacterium spheniscorum TaxID=185761 RepID=A0A1I2UGG9_9CORY|nr:DUF3566 domain-containing protein [Corynebacterium spheniscorum]KAA8720415.1 DUF3566 domain-containing protein [Corynebacterium spheniscorum]SFG76113.1 Transmembrane protein of unknown function [Corynebacterium spheniscorum]
MATRQVSVVRISPMSAFRVALAMSLVALVAWIITVALLYYGLQTAGIWDKLNSVVAGVGGDQVVGFGMVMAVASLVGAIAAILMTILAPLAAVIYNAIVDLFGGIRLTLHERRS